MLLSIYLRFLRSTRKVASPTTPPPCNPSIHSTSLENHLSFINRCALGWVEKCLLAGKIIFSHILSYRIRLALQIEYNWPFTHPDCSKINSYHCNAGNQWIIELLHRECPSHYRISLQWPNIYFQLHRIYKRWLWRLENNLLKWSTLRENSILSGTKKLRSRVPDDGSAMMNDKIFE